VKSADERGSTSDDIARLDAVLKKLDGCESLTSAAVREAEAFASMRIDLKMRGGRLSEKQLKWLQAAEARLDVATTSLNLVSRGLVPLGNHKRVKLPHEQPGYVKVLKPPGR